MLSAILPEKFLRWLRGFIGPLPEDLNHYLSAEKSFIDIGAGNGYLLSGISATAKRSAVEIWDKKITYLRQTLPGVMVYKSIYEVADFFDVVSCIDVLHHIEDDAERELFLRKLFLLVKPGGMLIIKDMRDDLFIHKYFNRLSDFVSTRSHTNEMNEGKLCDKLAHAGFTIASRKHYSVGLYAHYYLACRKI